ncbi:MBL fold metallo-hydrolase [Bacillus cereus]|uniref:MBL fold metallo-hydrolase n=1 Tax=Bacillus cereus TaxID=1396 RepID=UPI00190D9F1C|nr:MBL fold metallo-hydrolase [Bacillus cereus]MBK4742078.1 MBL fold metallo-hydrolase [Bacillus cereus]
MEFIALPVKNGDSFLLKDKNFNLLVDGGNGQTRIKKHIKKYTDNLNVVICTHYDWDHVKGLLNLFREVIYYRNLLAFLMREREFSKGEAKRFYEAEIKRILNEELVTFNEIWLPDIFGRIALFKRQKTKGIIIPKDSDEVRILMEDRKEYEENKRRYEEDERGNEEVIYRNNKGFDMDIKTICRLVRICHVLVEEYGVKIRWFTYVNEIKNEHIKHNIYAINCEELDRRIEPYGSEEEVIYQFTQINRESLVFRYNEAEEGNGLPNVLFTADSNFEFCRGEKVPFNQSVAIVTVPHHGSRDKEHKKVYENLGEDMEYVFVRSSERHKSRPSEEYKKYPRIKRYCIRCGREGSDQQTVHLKFNERLEDWVPAIGVMNCTCF